MVAFVNRDGACSPARTPLQQTRHPTRIRPMQTRLPVPFACSVAASDMPLLATLDIEAAFPSVAHAWIFMVLQWLEVPLDLYYFIEGVYFANSVFVDSWLCL